jgi:hypothetical protein
MGFIVFEIVRQLFLLFFCQSFVDSQKSITFAVRFWDMRTGEDIERNWNQGSGNASD